MKVTYEIVEHNGGWAYKSGVTFSETFDTREQAQAAAHQAAGEQLQSGESTEIQYEDENDNWLIEDSPGDDRPETEVKD